MGKNTCLLHTKKMMKTYFAGAFSLPALAVVAELVAVDEPA